jgi:hypothetical protein
MLIKSSMQKIVSQTSDKHIILSNWPVPNKCPLLYRSQSGLPAQRGQALAIACGHIFLISFVRSFNVMAGVVLSTVVVIIMLIIVVSSYKCTRGRGYNGLVVVTQDLLLSCLQVSILYGLFWNLVLKYGWGLAGKDIFVKTDSSNN